MAEEQKTDEVPAEPTHHIEPKKSAPATSGSRLQRFKTWYAARKPWTIPASILLLLLLLAAIPFTRYGIAGLAVKHDITVKVVDATANTPVSGATLTMGSVNVQTDSKGSATLHKVKAGHHEVVISKKYYRDSTINILSPLFGQASSPSAEITATGRQVKITVKNLINKNTLADVGIKVADITAKTDQTGTALLVLPAGIAEQKAQLTADGFNDTEVTIKVNSSSEQDNTFNLAPAGKVYFLSKLSGKVDVVKTNLDGSGRQTVLAGTGNEDDRNTVLLASRDWKYLALLSRRAGTNPSLYLIDTSNDSNTVMDSGSNVDFNLIGWANDTFIYTASHSDIQNWQNGRDVIKAYNAQTKKNLVLDQTTGAGSGTYDFVGETLGDVFAYEDQVYYDKGWNSSYNPYDNKLANKQATFNTVKTDGTGKKAIKSFSMAAGAYSNYLSLDERIKSPNVIALHFYDGNNDNFYLYANGQVKTDPQGSNNTFFSASYPTYLQSPSGDKTFWSEPRDGKNTLFIGDEAGQGSSQIASLSDYNTYGWFSDNYLLVSKNSSELYIMDNAGKQTPVKISDYHKPALTFQGYGGGYGGF